MTLKLQMNRLPQLLAGIAADRQLYLPLEAGGQVNYGLWTADGVAAMDTLITTNSPKEFFLPQTENLVSFKTKGKEISIIESRSEAQSFAVFGVRACDVKSLEILDRVFLSDPVDTFYQRRRENGVIISRGCGAPEETCFCHAFGIDAVEPGGDIVTWADKDTLYWRSVTEKGEALTETVRALFQEADEGDEAALEAEKSAAREIIGRLPLSDLRMGEFDQAKGDSLFQSDKWEELSRACVACGTCTFVCPTCQCYDIRDFNTGNGVERFRCWDSCLFSDFTLMAHGNPRTSRVERFRQRYMHKLVYFPTNNGGEYACVGCGRCVIKCPISMNMVKAIKALGVAEHV